MRNGWGLAFAGVVVLFGGVGCGDDGGQDSASPPSPPNPEVPIEPPGGPPNVDEPDNGPPLEQVADVNKTEEKPSIDWGITSLGDVFYFGADDGSSGVELWRSDGTPQGTQRAVDLNKGPLGSDPRTLVAHQGALYFTADDGKTGRQLHRSDGTEAGTVRLTSTDWGTGDNPWPTKLVSTPSGLFFMALNRKLYRSDGTAQGTVATSATIGSFSNIVALSGGGVAFEGTKGAESGVFVSDGTDAGTTLIFASGANKFPGSPFVGSNGKIYFAVTSNGASAGELYASDGTAASTIKVATLAAPGDTFTKFSRVSTKVIVTTYETVQNTKKYGLYVTDGTIAGTAPLANAPNSYAEMHVLGDKTLMASQGLYVTDGATVTKISDQVSPYWFATMGGFAYFLDDGVSVQLGAPTTLYRTDGTTGGTVAVKQLPTPVGFSTSRSLAATSTKLLFVGDTAKASVGLWTSDGTAPNTIELPSINKSTAPSHSRNVTALRDGALFTAEEGKGKEARGLYFTNPKGTTRLASFDLPKGHDIDVGGAGPFAVVDDRAYFLTREGLYKTDGTPGGTSLLKAGGTQKFPAGERFTFAIGKTVYFVLGRSAQFQLEAYDLWQTDGTPSGTKLAIEKNPVSLGSSLSADRIRFAALGEKLLFTAAGGALYALDKGAATLIVDADAYLESMHVMGGYLYYAKDGALLRSDGNGPGTMVYEDPAGEKAVSRVMGGATRLYFAMSDRPRVEDLWTSDGTPGGTKLVARLSDDLQLQDMFESAAVAGETLYFDACKHDGSAYTCGLWASDGTSVGTREVKAVQGAKEFFPVGNALYFSADDGVHGAELFRSDGTAQGTTLVAEVGPGARGSLPKPLGVTKTRIYFAADDYKTGTELWRLRLP